MRPDGPSSEEAVGEGAPHADEVVAAMAGWIERCVADALVRATHKPGGEAMDRVTLETTFELVGEPGSWE